MVWAHEPSGWNGMTNQQYMWIESMVQAYTGEVGRHDYAAMWNCEMGNW
jgi:hypothetical protein